MGAKNHLGDSNPQTSPPAIRSLPTHSLNFYFRKAELISQEHLGQAKYQEATRETVAQEVKPRECFSQKRSSKSLSLKKTHMLTILASNFVREQFKKHAMILEQK